jgi:hypothetical protein
MDPRFRIHPKISWIRNTAFCLRYLGGVFLKPGQVLRLVKLAQADGGPLAGTLLVVLINWTENKVANQDGIDANKLYR